MYYRSQEQGNNHTQSLFYAHSGKKINVHGRRARHFRFSIICGVDVA